MRRSWFFLALAALVGAACAAGEVSTPDDEDGTGGTGAGGAPNGGGGVGGSAITVGVGGSGGGEVITEVFGHSGDTLYRLDTVTNVIVEVGPFSNCGINSVLDIALDKDSNLYAVKRTALYTVDRLTAACTLVHELASGQYPDSLGFVEAGTLDPNEEVLVGYQNANYVRIDPSTGALSVVASNVLPPGKISSGDIVSVENGPTYLTIKDESCSSNCPPDSIVEIDPSTGSVIQDYGSVGYPGVFGIAFWGGSVFGFAKEGVLFKVTFGDFTVVTDEIPFPNAPANLEFFGAGSSTSVPLVVPE